MAKTPIAVFHPGTQHSWQTATALQQLDQLAFYATSIFYQPDAWPYRIERHLPAMLRDRMHREFRRFVHPGLDPALVRTSGLSEWLERITARAGWRGMARRIDAFGNQRFARSMRTAIDGDAPFALWGYNNSSLGAFRAAKAKGRRLILDRTIGDWRAYNAIMEPVFCNYPEYFIDPNYRMDRATIEREDEEYTLADAIITGSPFAADTVRAYASDPSVADRVRVISYCFDEQLFGQGLHQRRQAPSTPLRFLFLGQAGPRKGIHLILNLFDRISAKAASLTVVGDLQVPARTFARHADRVTYRPTVARADVPALLADHDVLLFPSYFEGGGIVLYEAMATGMAVIQSNHCALAVTPDTGIMMPELNEESLENAVMTAIEDRNQVEAWQHRAPSIAERYSFGQYRANIASMLDDIGL